MKREFKIEVTRDGRWWMVRVPEIDGLTQARRLAEVETMAREFIALDQSVPLDDVSVVIVSVRLPRQRELLESADAVKELRERATQLERAATQKARAYAKWLTAESIPVRDIAELLGISPQRVSQLANSAG
jgi:DNA-directed RNA polymerase specialized sigma subunit